MTTLTLETTENAVNDSDSPSTPDRFAGTLESVCGKIAPVWPLEDYVAINPYSGFASQSLTQTHQAFRQFSEGTLLMPLHYYAAEYRDKKVSSGHIAAAIEQLQATVGDSGVLPGLPDILFALNQSLRQGCEIVEFGTQNESPEGRWGTAIVEEISRHCSAHYDHGQSVWQSPFKGLSLYAAWRETMRRDRKFEWMGVKDFRRFVSELPDTADEAILELLRRLDVPESQRESFLLSRAFTVPGWCGWTKYQGISTERARIANDEDRGAADEDLIGLLAIRLAYDVALDHPIPLYNENRVEAISDDVWIRSIMLRASELAFQESIVGPLVEQAQSPPSDNNGQSLAQMVFCIDVRSERYRRRLESSIEKVDTFGFAGFFGLPIEFVPMGQTKGAGQVPVLLTPAFKVHETIEGASEEAVSQSLKSRASIRSWRKAWKLFATSAVGCFSFVETTGWLSAGSLLGRTLRIGQGRRDVNRDGVGEDCRTRLTLSGLEEQGITLEKQIDMAQAVLTNLGITEEFARLVVFCGHGSTTENNPLQAGLDCGACGGHTGESNARFAAMLINQASVRAGLAKRGIIIPEDTHFLPALHNTTTDEITFYDESDVPASRQSDLEALRNGTVAATRLTQAERMPLVASDSIDCLLRRSQDWSEVRPEWGLAGNAAFIVARRSLTQSLDLGGRVFLHSYEEAADPEAAVLEGIMTAPLVVAHLINMQYYASTVDNNHFGSGSKTVHNVVGGFGVLAGNGGDLQTGLPIQSLHDGSNWVHEPIRLLGVLAVKRTSIDGILAKHAGLRESIVNGWLNLIAIDDGNAYRYDHLGQWVPIG